MIFLARILSKHTGKSPLIQIRSMSFLLPESNRSGHLAHTATKFKKEIRHE